MTLVIGDVASWAGVFVGVVAIGMTLNDRSQEKTRREEEKQRRKDQARVLKTLIRQEIEDLSNSLLRVQAELYGNPRAADVTALAFALMADPEAATRIRSHAVHIDMPLVREFFEYLTDLEPAFLESLEKLLFGTLDLRRYLEYSINPGDDVARIDWLREKYEAANTAMTDLRRLEQWW